MKRRNEAARLYALAHAGHVADFAALYYRADRIRKNRPRDAVVPLFRLLEPYRRGDMTDDQAGLAHSLSERLLERDDRSAFRHMMCEFGGEPPDDSSDPEDAQIICDHLSRLPVPGVRGLAILTRLVDGLPGVVVANTRPDRTLPTRVAMVAGRAAEADAARARGRLFTPAMHLGVRDGREQALPGFVRESEDFQGPALPLALYDLGGGSSTSPGQPAPLALRLWIEAILSVPIHSRHTNVPMPIGIPFRFFLKRLYPHRRPRPNEYWPRLTAAAEALSSNRARIPWYDPATGRGGLRSVVTVVDIPRGPRALNDVVTLMVHLPPGSGPGPVVSPRLPHYGLKSAVRYRALINLAYRWFVPGRTRIPVGPAKRRHWVQSNDPSVYPRIDGEEAIEICFPTSARKQRRNLLSEAGRELRALAKDGEVRLIDKHVMPPLVRPSPGATVARADSDSGPCG